MKVKKIFFLIVTIIGLSGNVCSQYFERTYVGQWAMTNWTFNFHNNGNFERTSQGHYGQTEYIGKYIINKDTMEIITGFENTGGTVGQYYLIEGDSFIVDLAIFYDYKNTPNQQSWSYISRERYDIKNAIRIDSILYITKSEFDSIIRISTNNLLKKSITQFDDIENLQIIRCFNTIWINGRDKKDIDHVYMKFIDAYQNQEYELNMRRLNNFIVSRGLGFYFTRLGVELGGTPHSYSYYTIQAR